MGHHVKNGATVSIQIGPWVLNCSGNGDLAIASLPTDLITWRISYIKNITLDMREQNIKREIKRMRVVKCLLLPRKEELQKKKKRTNTLSICVCCYYNNTYCDKPIGIHSINQL